MRRMGYGRRRSAMAMPAIGVSLAVFLFSECNMPSLQDLDQPLGKSTLVLVPSTVNLKTGETTTFSASGGTSPYTFSVEPGEGTIGQNGLYQAPGMEGTYIVTVTDATGDSTEATVMVTTSVPLSVSPASITVAAGTTVTLVASGGTGAYNISRWAGSGVFHFTPGTSTATYVSYYVDNALIRVTSGSEEVFAMIVSNAPPPLQITPSSITLPPDTSFTFTATGGAGSYTWDCGSGSVDSSGTYTSGPVPENDIAVTVSDEGGHSATAYVDVVVSPDLILSPPDLNVIVGNTVTLIASGGTGPYSFALSGRGSISSATPQVTYTAPPTAGMPETATITVTDSATPIHGSATATINLEQPPALQIYPDVVSLTTNEGVTFTATGGSGGYQYSVLPPGTGFFTDPYNGQFTGPAVQETDWVRVTDSGGRTSDARVDVYFPLTIVPTDAFVEVNGTYTFSASGGKEPYEYHVMPGGRGGSIELTSGLYTAPGNPSPPDDVVQVLDALGNASYATVTVYSPDWVIQSVDTAFKSGQYASLALDPVTGYPSVAYYESQAKELRLVTWNGSSWSSQIVDTTVSAGQYCSLALDPSPPHYPRISYYDSSNRNLKYASWNGSSWSLQVVDSDGTVGQYTSLALDPSTGHPRISYYDFSNKNLKYASWDGSGWTTSVVDSIGDVGKYSSLALDQASGKPRIAYYDATTTKLKYAAWNGSSWQVAYPDGVTQRGQYCSLALDPSTGDPRISYYNSGANRLWYAWYDGIWHADEVDTNPSDRGMYTSLALDPSSGNPRISYFDNSTIKKLLYATYNGSDWNIQEDIDPASGVGAYSSLRLTSGGKAVIAYYNQSAQDLKLAEEP